MNPDCEQAKESEEMDIQSPTNVLAKILDPSWIKAGGHTNYSLFDATGTENNGGEGGEKKEPTAEEKAAAEAKAKEESDKLKGKTVEELTSLLAASEAEKAKLLKETMSRKAKLGEAATEKQKLEAEKAAWLEAAKSLFGENVSIEDLKSKIEEKKAAEVEALKKAGNFTELQSRMGKEHQAAIDKLNGAHGAKVKDLETKLVSAEGEIRRLLVSNAFASSKFINEELVVPPAKAEKLFGEHFKVEAGDNGRFVKAYVGTEPLVNAEGNPLSFEEALREIVNRDSDKELLFKPTARKGAGSGAENRGKEMDKTLPKGESAIVAGLKQLQK